MRIVKKSAFKKVLAAVIVALVTCGLIFFIINNNNAQPETKPPADKSSVPADQPEDAHTTDDGTIGKPSVPPQNDPQPAVGDQEDISAKITSLNDNGGTVVLRVIIEGVTNEGVCNLSIHNTATGKEYSVQSGIQALSSSSTCKGFNIATSLLGSGEWELSIIINIGGKQTKLTDRIGVG